MALTRDNFDKQFAEYRDRLRHELHRFMDSVEALRELQRCAAVHGEELNLAPGFFWTVQDALITKIVLWADKLLDPKSERGMFNFLVFVENNRKWLKPSQLQRRRQYPDDHWMLRSRKPITLKEINEHRTRLKKLACLQSVRTARDKNHAHFDKEYFLDASKLAAEAPITWDDLAEAAELMGKVIDYYSVDFDGVTYSWSSSAVSPRPLLEEAERSLRDQTRRAKRVRGRRIDP